MPDAASDLLARRFDEHRDHLHRVAERMLGAGGEADDVVQDAWLRLHRADAGGIGNLGAWLTTVVARLCLDRLRARGARREEPMDDAALDALDAAADAPTAEDELLLGDAMGAALLVVLDTLGPAERLAFVLHDLFGVSFDEIAPIVGRTPAAARQLASRARRRVRGARAAHEGSAAARARRQEIVAAFLAASRGGDFAGLLALLDPDVVLRADAAAVAMGAVAEVRGADDVARTFAGRAQGARPALVDGEAGAAWMAGRTPRVVFGFTIERDRVVEISLVADAGRLAAMELVLLER